MRALTPEDQKHIDKIKRGAQSDTGEPQAVWLNDVLWLIALIRDEDEEAAINFNPWK